MSRPTEPKPVKGAKMSRCPICGNRADADARPFCSKRCADVDLYRWLTGAYAFSPERSRGNGPDEGEGDD